MDNELKLLGKALLSVQKFEFAFYGLATHFPKQNNLCTRQKNKKV